MSKEWVNLEDKNFLTTTYLRPIEKELYRCLVFHARDSKEGWPSQETIGNFIQRDVRTVGRIIHSMLEKRVITWEPGFAGKSNNYTIWTYNPGFTIFDESKLAPKRLVREQLQRSRNISDSKKHKTNIRKFKVV